MQEQKKGSFQRVWDLLSCIVTDNNKVERVKVYVCVCVCMWDGERTGQKGMSKIITQELYESRNYSSNVFNNIVSAQFEKILTLHLMSSSPIKKC